MNKQHILEEIARTATANDGRPLGYQKFAAETGIRESDWKGRHWARWSDALAEAGLVPNSMNKARDADAVMAQFAMLARAMGRIPAEAEIVMKRRSDSAFPSMSVFRRIGSSADRISKLADYCRRVGGFDDVLTLCEAVANVSDAADDGSSAGEQEAELGFVYLMKSGRSDGRRRASLQTAQVPVALILRIGRQFVPRASPARFCYPPEPTPTSRACSQSNPCRTTPFRAAPHDRKLCTGNPAHPLRPSSEETRRNSPFASR